MDGLTLLNEAQAAGLVVVAKGNRLVIRGPQRAEPTAKLLLIHKAAVMAALGAAVKPNPKHYDVPTGWTARSWIGRLRDLAGICINPIRAMELAEWADGLERIEDAREARRTARAVSTSVSDDVWRKCQSVDGGEAPG